VASSTVRAMLDLDARGLHCQQPGAKTDEVSVSFSRPLPPHALAWPPILYLQLTSKLSGLLLELLAVHATGARGVRARHDHAQRGAGGQTHH